jgi:hypothetical protein
MYFHAILGSLIKHVGRRRRRRPKQIPLVNDGKENLSYINTV